MTANQMLARTRDLPPVSTAALGLCKLLEQNEVTQEEVLQVLSNDSVLTAKLLRICNSAAMGLKQPVSSVQQGVLLLGHDKLSQLASAIAFHGTLAAPVPGFALDVEELWRHSLATANAAQLAGVELGFDGSTAFTAGLLHDMGKLVTANYLTRESALALQERARQGGSVVELEREILGTDHAEVGSNLAYLWRLPYAIVESIAHHHTPVLAPEPLLSALVALANNVAHYALEAAPGQPPPRESPAFPRLGCDNEFLEKLAGQVREQSAWAQEQAVLAA